MDNKISNGQDNRTVNYFIVFQGNNNLININNDGQQIINASEGTFNKEQKKTIFKRIVNFLESVHLGKWLIDILPWVLTVISSFLQFPHHH